MTAVLKFIKRRLPKIAAVLAAAALCVFALPADRLTAEAVDIYQFNENGFYYTISAVSGTIEACIVGYKSPTGSAAGGITIPAALGTYAVTAIGSNAFADQSTITSVSVPQSVRSIGAGAFQNCTGLTTVSISAGVTSIAENSFKGCTSLTAVNLPATVTSIGTSAFENCGALKTIGFSAALTSIGNYAFRRCSAIESVVLPNSVTSVGEGAFEECSAMKTLTLSTGLTRIEDFTFYKCGLLTPLTIPDNISVIGRYAFSECSSLSSVSFPKSVVSIGASAFENCRYLAVAIIPNTTEYIASTAFRNDPLAIYGYSGTYAEQFARDNNIPFTSYGAVYKVTFSADIYFATIDNISIRSAGSVIIPPSTVQNDEELTITATAPDGYIIDHITINNEAFTNGSVYRVHNNDVNIFVSYKLRDSQSSSTTTAVTPITTTSTTTTAARATTVTTVSSSTTTTTTTRATTASSDDTTLPPDDTTDDPYITVDSTLEGVGGNNVRIITQRSNFIGPATVRLSNTAEASQAAEAAAQSLAGEETLYYYGFDISLYDENGRENSGIMSGGAITFQVPVPDILAPYMDDIRVYHIEDGEPVLLTSGIVEDINGIKRVQFEANSFSPYMFVTGTDEFVNIDEGEIPVSESDDSGNGEGDGEVTVISDDEEDPSATSTTRRATAGNTENNSGSGNGGFPFNPATGALLFIAIPSVTLACALLVRKEHKEKRTRTKNEIK